MPAGENSVPEDPWMACMRRGDFAAAWEIADDALRRRGRRPCWHRPRHEQAVWDGRPLAGRRVLIRCYHGLGDTMQFIRYAPLVRAIAREVIVWAQPALLPLLAHVPGIDRLLPLHDGAPAVDYEVDVEVMELPHVFRSTLETLPANVPYLRGFPLAERRAELRVGLVWSAGDWDPRRSIPVAALAPLLAHDGIEFHLLQRGHTTSAPPAGARVRDSSSDDAVATARVVCSLDVAISVDSFPAHLAGALGVPTWLLLPEPADWRWMTAREDSPWYPTMRLFRQTVPGAWAEVLGWVGRELTAARKIRPGDFPKPGAQTPCNGRAEDSDAPKAPRFLTACRGVFPSA